MFPSLKQRITNFISDEKFSEVFAGSVMVLFARVFTAALGLFASIIIAKRYGAEAVGVVAVTNSFLMLVSLFTVLGTKTSVLRLIPEHLAKYSPTSAYRVFHKAQLLVVAVSFIAGGIFFYSADLIADKVFAKQYLAVYFSLAAGFVVFKSLTELNAQAVRGLRLIRTYAVMQLLPQGFNLVLLFSLGLVVTAANDIPVYALLGSFVLTGLIGLLVMEYSFRKRIQPQDIVQDMSTSEILTISLPMFMTASMTFTIGQTGVLMLSAYTSEAEVGYYAIAVKMATLTAFIYIAVNSMVAPKFSELYYSDKIDELFYVARKSAKLIFWVTAPVLLGLIVFGRPVLSYFFGQDFAQAYPALLILIFGQFVHSISGSTSQFMDMTGHQVVLRNIMLIAAFLNIGLNLLLVPHLGINGSAIAAMFSICFWNIAILIYTKAKFGRTTGYFPRFFGSS